MLKGVKSTKKPEEVLGADARVSMGLKSDYKGHKHDLGKDQHLYLRCFIGTGEDRYICVDDADIFRALVMAISILDGFGNMEVWAVPDSTHRKFKAFP